MGLNQTAVEFDRVAVPEPAQKGLSHVPSSQRTSHRCLPFRRVGLDSPQVNCSVNEDNPKA